MLGASPPDVSKKLELAGHGTHHIRTYIAAASAFILAHFAALAAFPRHAELVSYIFQVTSPWAAAFACMRRAWLDKVPVRSGWLLLSAGLALWALGMTCSAWEDLVTHSSSFATNISDFFYFFYGAPVVAAITLPDEIDLTGRTVIPDILQLGLLGVLAYISVYHIVPFLEADHQPTNSSFLVQTYNVENIALLGIAAFRGIGRLSKPEWRPFDIAMTTFLASYAITAAIYNGLEERFLFLLNYLNPLVDIPFLGLILLALQPAVEHSAEPGRRSLVSVYLEGFGPALFTLCSLVLAIRIARDHPRTGEAGIVIALAAFALRAALWQGRHLEIQAALLGAQGELRQMAALDGLTGISNRRSFDEYLEKCWQHARAYRSNFSMLLIDVDHFKNLNDVYGHIEGDKCLIRIAGTLKAALRRSSDLVSRYGGEEFAVLLPNTSLQQAAQIAAEICAAIRDLNIENQTGQTTYATVSIGVAANDGAFQDRLAIVKAADSALYEAKHRGRDRVEIYPAEQGFA